MEERKRYTKECKEEAVRLPETSGKNTAGLAKPGYQAQRIMPRTRGEKRLLSIREKYHSRLIPDEEVVDVIF